ncbi:Lsm12p NDAI_0F02870 [Naumovozyma dairenensis CBS 421]|uniref:AD domain-containing protein n=1 Tax=Naumovozyma dairenensis (strain ATCC 10597 / BCRC 20456 / CBS 421 / NBRC 0211 / NRRL Y-12639) TaxID=1071378 RepID=G0WCU4_NAUDC|nr:hypothetical protein NDAI_0F02870 [Naumovozyma dairenensis CBS 421]CCD25605.1 hypothetical protein NDAI_0F02870 [Naumovozyma dairenensis CBS 421]
MSVNLTHILGWRVRITNILDTVTEGRIYSFNSSNNTITLDTTTSTKKNKIKKSKETNLHDFKIIKCLFIKHLEVIDDKSKKQSGFGNIKPSYINIDRIDQLLKDQIAKASIKEGLLNRGVTEEGQFIFNLIHKTISDTKWGSKSNSIIILGDIEISSPYKVDNIKCLHESDSNSKNSLNLIVKIVQNGWAKWRINHPDSDNDDGRKGG